MLKSCFIKKINFAAIETQLLTAETYEDVVTDLLALAQSFGLTATAWQKLGITRTTITTIAAKIATVQNMIVTGNAGGFLTLAADGPLDAAGNITPGFVDLCAYNQFNVTRAFAQAATATVQVTNTSGSTYTIQANYGGDSNYGVSNAQVKLAVVPPIA